MDYNSKRKKMPLPEYGRNIQNMVDYLLTIEDREMRNRAAKTVIDVMGNLNPHLRDIADFKHKLWDHIAIMADFKLDIDYPYEPPSPNLLLEKPKVVAYNQNEIKYRHYGRIMEEMIDEATKFEEGEQKEVLVRMLANHMKKSYLTWNKDAVDDEKIIKDLAELSQREIQREGMELVDTKTVVGKSKNKKVPRKKNNGKYY
ncbi:MAG: DUF4290 domain-containing protein [Prolixibacteraceae bacterium]|nr:DUF4290 domain-containing protein [Prolixibacteraceae bacterium]